MFCYQCGKQLEEGALFCGICGAKKDVLPQPITISCHQCDNPLEDGEQFCGKCGAQKNATTSIALIQAIPQSLNTHNSPNIQTYAPKCGRKVLKVTGVIMLVFPFILMVFLWVSYFFSDVGLNFLGWIALITNMVYMLFLGILGIKDSSSYAKGKRLLNFAWGFLLHTIVSWLAIFALASVTTTGNIHIEEMVGAIMAVPYLPVIIPYLIGANRNIKLYNYNKYNKGRSI